MYVVGGWYQGFSKTTVCAAVQHPWRMQVQLFSGKPFSRNTSWKWDLLIRGYRHGSGEGLMGIQFLLVVVHPIKVQ